MYPYTFYTTARHRFIEHRATVARLHREWLRTRRRRRIEVLRSALRRGAAAPSSSVGGACRLEACPL